MYADDTSISFSSKSIAEINEAVNSDAIRLQTWLLGNKLSLNVAKTQSMILGSSINLKKHHIDNGYSEIILHINGDNLARIGSNKYLGVQIDSEPKWREHITFAIGKISSGQLSFSYRGVKVWNKLSTEIKSASLLATFQNLLKQSLKNQRV